MFHVDLEFYGENSAWVCHLMLWFQLVIVYIFLLLYEYEPRYQGPSMRIWNALKWLKIKKNLCAIYNLLCDIQAPITQKLRICACDLCSAFSKAEVSEIAHDWQYGPFIHLFFPTAPHSTRSITTWARHPLHLIFPHFFIAASLLDHLKYLRVFSRI